MVTEQTAPQQTATIRIAAIDAYRGFVMLLMLLECLHLARLAKQFPESTFCKIVAVQTTHVEWVGCSLHDLIQPSFSFLVGVGLVFSTFARREKKGRFSGALMRACWRSLFLIAWGVILRSVGDNHTRTNFTFEDTLSQIGLGYVPLFLIAQLRMRWWWLAFAVLVVGYWIAFVIYPLPLSDYDGTLVGVPMNWPNHAEGLAAHWNKNSNLAWAFDTWFLNLFPRQTPFKFNSGGYCTLSFVPTLATMILGLVGGEMIRRAQAVKSSLLYLVLLGMIDLAVGRAMNDFGLCPLVKRIWTPSWVFFSGGWCFLLLAMFYASTDAIKLIGWSFLLRVIGANSILIYTIAELPIRDFFVTQLLKHIPHSLLTLFSENTRGLVANLIWLVAAWLFLWFLYRKKLFLRV